MSSCGIRGFAVVLGGVAAILGAALLSTPVACADQPFPVPPYLIDVRPPGQLGEPTDSEFSGIPFLLSNNQETVPYQIFDPHTGTLLGDYVAKEENGTALVFFQNDWAQVIDSTGAAPAVGTLWDTSQFGIPLIFGTDISFLPVLLNNYESDPTGTTQDWFQIAALQVGNYFSTGPAGTLDELTFQGLGPFSFALPIFDIPATASAAVATDGGSLLSELAAIF